MRTRKRKKSENNNTLKLLQLLLPLFSPYSSSRNFTIPRLKEEGDGRVGEGE
jgi:hypothetical protein